MLRYIRFVPNTLSTIRLILACAFPFTPEQLWVWLIIAGGGSDVLDGWVARKWQVQSRLGAILDGVADKLFVLIALLTVAGAGKFSLWWVLPLLSRDLLVAFTAVYAAAVRSWESFNKMDVRWSGKLATFGQFFLLLTVVLYPAGIQIMLWFAILLSVVSAIDYGRLFIRELHQRATDTSL
jgi:CDP-diacylglycerol--glycerol-3-phosphate 3-phosphatidyltransferase